MIRLANAPEPHTVNTAGSVLAMFKADRLSAEGHRDIPAPEPDPEPNPAPDDALGAGRVDISIADWDRLFHAVVLRLQNSSGYAPLNPMPEHGLGTTATLNQTESECLASLNSLHVLLKRERQQRERPA